MSEKIRPGVSSRSTGFNLTRGAFARKWLWLVLWLLSVTLINSSLYRWLPSTELIIYLIQPVLWLSVGGLAYFFWRVDSVKTSLNPGLSFLGIAAMVGVFQVSVNVTAGVIAGFGKSPYSHQPLVVFLNIWFVLTRYIGLEFARWYLVSAWRKAGERRAVVLTWLVLTLASLPLGRASSVAWNETGQVFYLFGGIILPGAAQNMLLTYLSLIGGPFASLAYRIPIAAFEWLSPILPDLKFVLYAFVSSIVPILGVLFIREIHEWRTVRQGQAAQDQEGISTGWVLLSVLMVFILWFNSGLFGVRPTLISGISMEPAIQTGDIVITRNVSPQDVKPGDVVLFEDGTSAILHRVIKLESQGGQLVFQTKGDNVEIFDKPWNESQLRGKLVIVIPKLGWISIGMKMLFNRLFE